MKPLMSLEEVVWPFWRMRGSQHSGQMQRGPPFPIQLSTPDAFQKSHLLVIAFPEIFLVVLTTTLTSKTDNFKEHFL